MEEGRKVGDTGIVKTTYGYHIMYCSDINEAWYAYALDSVIYDMFNLKMEETEKVCVLEFDVDAIALGGIPVQEEVPEATGTVE